MYAERPIHSQVGVAEKQYSVLEPHRKPYLDRARECSILTIPALVPPEGFPESGTGKLYTPFQGIGARGVNNLASKLLLTLLPANSPFFRYALEEFSAELEQNPKLKTKIEKGLAKVEKAIVADIETTAIRVPFFEGLKHLIVAGNVLVYITPDTGEMRVFHLNRYVVRRDPMGRVLEIIVKEDVAPATLSEMFPKEIVEQIESKYRDSQEPDKTCSIYTRILRKDGAWKVHQEVKGIVIPDSRGTYPLDKCPWMALRFTRIAGEDYGRGYVEEYLGDLVSLEGLAQAIVEGSAAAAKVLFFVNPNGSTRKKDVAEAPNGSVRDGNSQDVTVLQMEKFNDFRVAQETMREIVTRLSFAFLLNSSIQRAGERVTAEEIRYMAGELEDALGGVYSILSQEFQLPLVNYKMHQMTRQKRIPKLPKSVRPKITTGLEALGRGHDLRKLDAFIQGLQQSIGPELLQKYLNVGEYIERRAVAGGIDTDNLINTEEQIAQQDQQAQMMGLIQKLGPNAINAFGGMAKQSMAQGGGQEMAAAAQSAMTQAQG